MIIDNNFNLVFNFNHKILFFFDEMELKGYISFSNFPIKFSTFILFNYLDKF